MWLLEKIERLSTELDFTASGQDRFRGNNLVIDGVQFANAIEQTSWEAEEFQTIVCEACGVESCEPSGWLSLRRSGDQVFFTPSPDAFSDDEWTRHEYRPPWYVFSQGTPLARPESYARLRSLLPGLPPTSAIPELTARELVRLLQLEATDRVLRCLPHPPAVEHDMIIAVSEGDLATQLETLGGLLTTHRDSAELVGQILPSIGAVIPVFYLASPESPEWRPLVFRDQKAHLHFEPGLLALVKGAA